MNVFAVRMVGFSSRVDSERVDPEQVDSEPGDAEKSSLSASEYRSARRRVGDPRSRVSALRGVTLIELLLVVVLIAAASLLAAAAFSGGMSGAKLRSEAKEVAAYLRFTRARAIASGQAQRFVIDPAAHTWTAPDGRDGEIAENLTVVFTGARELQPSAGEGAIVFFPTGGASGGRVRLSLDDAAYDVEVSWVTGEVTVERGEVAQ